MGVKDDHELAVIRRIFSQLATLAPPARRRVVDYVSARCDTLPVLASVGGGSADDGADPPIIEFLDRSARGGAA